MANWPKDCDCYTDEEGFWRLGPMCRAAEREEWAEMTRRLPHILKEMKTVRRYGEGRNVEQVELDEDGPL